MNSRITAALEAAPADAVNLLCSIVEEVKQAKQDGKKLQPPKIAVLEQLVAYAIDSKHATKTRRWAFVVLLTCAREWTRSKASLAQMKSLRKSIGRIIVQDNGELGVLAAALVARLWEYPHLDAIWPVADYGRVDLSKFPLDMEATSWSDDLDRFVEKALEHAKEPRRSDPKLVGVIIANQISINVVTRFKTAAIECAGRSVEDPSGLSCLAHRSYLTIMFAVPIGPDHLYFDISYRMVVNLESKEVLCDNNITGSQDLIPALTIHLLQEPGNCTVNGQSNKLESVTMLFINDSDRELALQILQEARGSDPGGNVQISQTFDASKPRAASDYGGEQKDLEGDAEQENAEYADETPFVHVNSRRGSPKSYVGDSMLFDKSNAEETAMSPPAEDGHMLTLKRFAETRKQRNAKLESSKLPAADAQEEHASPSGITSPEPEPPKQKGRPQNSSAKQTTSKATSTTQALRPKKVSAVKKPGRPARVLKPPLSKEVSAKASKPKAVAAGKENMDVYDVPDGSDSEELGKQMKQAFGKRAAKGTKAHASKVNNKKKKNAKAASMQSGKSKAPASTVAESTRSRKATAAAPPTKAFQDTRPLLDLEKRPKSDTQPLDIIEVAEPAVPVEENATFEDFEHEIVDYDARNVSPSNDQVLRTIQVGESASTPGSKNFDNRSTGRQLRSSAAKTRAAKAPAMSESHVSPGEGIDTIRRPMQDQKTGAQADPSSHSSATKRKLPASTAPRSTPAKAAKVQVPSSSRGRGALQIVLVDENAVKKKALISFGKHGAKNQGFRQAQQPKFSDFLDDEDDAKSKSGHVPSAGVMSSHQKTLHPSSKTTHEVLPSTGGRKSGNVAVAEVLQSSTKRPPPVAPNSDASRKKPKLADGKPDDDGFVPTEDTETALRPPTQTYAKRTPMRRQLTHITEEGSPHRQSPGSSDKDQIEVVTGKVNGSAAHKSAGSNVWSALLDPLDKNATDDADCPTENGSAFNHDPGSPDAIPSSPPGALGDDETVMVREDAMDDPFSASEGRSMRGQDFMQRLRSVSTKPSPQQKEVIDLTQEDDPESESESEDEVAGREPELEPQDDEALAAADTALEDDDEEMEDRYEAQNGDDAIQDAVLEAETPPKQAAADYEQADLHNGDDMDISSESSNDTDVADLQAQQTAAEAEWEASLQPRHRTLVASLNRVVRQFLGHVMKCEEALGDEVESYFGKASEIVQSMEEKHIAQMRDLQQQDARGGEGDTAKIMSRISAEHANTRRLVGEELAAWQQMRSDGKERVSNAAHARQ